MRNDARAPGRVLVLGLLFGLSVFLGCDDMGPSGPSGYGAFHIDLISPNGAEGSAVFELSPESDLYAVSSAGGEVYWEHFVGKSMVVVVLDQPGMIRFQVRTNNVRHVPAVTVVQVADGNDDLRSSVAGYTVEVVQVEDGDSQ